MTRNVQILLVVATCDAQSQDYDVIFRRFRQR
jgi:hypothetical protein